MNPAMQPSLLLRLCLEHRHSSIHYVTPIQHHKGRGKEILSRRLEVNLNAKQQRPERWHITRKTERQLKRRLAQDIVLVRPGLLAGAHALFFSFKS
jgi:hypothetical protein